MSEFTLQAIVAGDTSQLGEALDSIAMNEGQSVSELRTELANDFIQPFYQNTLWDAHLQLMLDALWPQISDGISRDDQFYTETQQLRHPLRELLEALLTGRHWSPREGKPAQQFLEKYLNLVQAANLHLATSQDEATLAVLRDEIRHFNDWRTMEEKRAAMLESRLCETELATLKQISAETRVIDLLNKHLANRPLPTDLHELINRTLKSELQYWAFNTDPDELVQLPLWKSWNRMLPALGQLFPAPDEPVDDQLLYQQIPLVIAELEHSCEHTLNDARSYQLLIDHFVGYLMSAIQKQPLESPRFPPLVSSIGQSGSNTRVPASLLKQTDQVQVGDWFIFSGEKDETLRCKLALKNPAVDQLLLVDHTGRKVMIKSHKDFALCLSTGIAKPLPEINLPQQIENTLARWVERANKGVQAQLMLQKRKAEQIVRALIAQQQAAAEAAEKERAETEARMQQQLEARRAAARKAIAEARALADEQRRREMQMAADAERLRIEQAATAAAEYQERQQAARQLVSELQVGAWLELTIDDQKHRAKLSVIIASTSKYIFADAVGRKVAEYQREQLQELIAQEQIKILRNGDNFEDQLAKVIRGLRRDTN